MWYKTIFNFNVKDSSINKVYPTEGKKVKYFFKNNYDPSQKINDFSLEMVKYYQWFISSLFCENIKKCCNFL